ncbi:MAG TPA: universal stress protein [Ferruginibacter sp.]|nr:universal stress protein [Ferruginibacter sp.]HMP21861.1 universal stress protein [Ferruginibacter sp.]
MNRIVVPVDFSTTSEKAFEYALHIAAKTKGSIMLYHNYKPLESPFVDTVAAREAYNNTMLQDHELQLTAFKNKVSAAWPGITITTVVEPAPLIDNLLEYIHAREADLIVMGTQGATGLKKVIIGSVAERVVKKSPIPVLLVPENFEWKDPSCFVFATSFEPADRHALQTVLPIAKAFGASVTVVHLSSDYLSHAEKEQEQAAFNQYAQLLQSEFSEEQLSFKLAHTSSLLTGMETLHHSIPYDLAVLVRREKTFLEKFFIDSFTTNMAYVTRWPLLVVPAVH